MALFKIKKGVKANLPTSYVEGYCYFTTDDGKFYIDTSSAASGRICLNAEQADKLTTISAGSSSKPVYWSGGKPVALSATVGSTSQPVYLNNGTLTACTGISTVGLVHVGASQPTSTNYTLWVDTDEADVVAMRNDAIKYKAFSIAISDWSGSGPYSYVISAPGITANSAILNLTLDAASQTYQKAQLDWETGANSITLSTPVKPTGTLSGYLIAVDVTVI